MKPPRKLFYILLISLIFVPFVFRFYTKNSLRVEKQYSSGVYIYLSKVLRFLFGWLPFSIGDLLYAAAFIYLAIKLFTFCKRCFLKSGRAHLKNHFYPHAAKLMGILLAIYITFNLFWGINYNREGIAWQLNLDTTAYTPNELKNINGLLVAAVNDDKAASLLAPPRRKDFQYIQKTLHSCYDSASHLYRIPSYSPSSLKPSLWGWLGNYSGFTGYYNPFTGEAQVNTTVPFFEQPFIAAHEVAHQLGYAKEMEANFVGFLAATSTTDPYFRYSVHMDLFLYANRNLYGLDSTNATLYFDSLLPSVKKDISERIAFSRKHKSFLQPVFMFIYARFLQSNEQPQGLMSYDEVTAFIISYYRKYKRL